MSMSSIYIARAYGYTLWSNLLENLNSKNKKR